MKIFIYYIKFLLLLLTVVPIWSRYYHQSRTEIGRNRRMMPALSYRHTWDRSDRWFNNRWWDIKEFPYIYNNDPLINQYSPIDCAQCNN